MPTSPDNRLRSERGFTLAELLVGCGIFGILAAIAVPRMTAAQPGFRLNGAARDVYAQLMWARGQAVEDGNRYVVTVPNNHTLSILDDNDSDGVADTGETVTTIDVQLAYPDVTISKSGVDPTFLPKGTTLGSTTFTVANSAGSRTITVSLTGVVKIN